MKPFLRLWHRHRILTSAFVLAMALAIFFAGRTIFFVAYWADPARQEGSSEHAGLGLAITQSIIRAHGGQILVGEGIDGQGTGITLCLPLPPQPEAESETP